MDREDSICITWNTLPAPVELNEKAYLTIPKSALQSVCKKRGDPHYILKNNRDYLRYLRFDGVVPADEGCWLWAQDGALSEYLLGASSIPFTSLPSEFASLKGQHRVSLDAANQRYLVIGIGGNDLIDRNIDVFVQTIRDGRWTRLPVLPVGILGDRPENMDRMRYRLFDDWLVTSVSAQLISKSEVKDTAVAEVLTVVSTGKQRADWGIEDKTRTMPDAAALPARRITLWNLADNRRIDLALPEDDSEIVHVFDNHQVLLRVHDKLFFAEIEGSRLTGYKLAAFDSAIPMVHWAWYANAANN